MPTFDSISRVLNTALALALGVTLWSCAVFGNSETKKTLWAYEDRYVRIEPQDGSSNTPPNEHPVTIPAEQLRAVLGALQVTLPKKSGLFSRSDDKNETMPVFTDKELDVLSEAIARGLSQAGVRQDITFLTVGNHRFIFGDFIKKRLTNTGRVFYQGGGLNIIFGQIMGKYPEPKGAGALVAERGELPKPGKRTAAPSHDWNLMLTEGIVLHDDAGVPRDDWVSIDTSAVLVYLSRMKEKQEIGEDLVEETGRLQTENTQMKSRQQELDQKVDKLEQELSTMKQGTVGQEGVSSTAGKVTPIVTPIVTPAVTPKVEPALEDRLTILKHLRDNGLISEDVYRSRVNKILDEAL